MSDHTFKMHPFECPNCGHDLLIDQMTQTIKYDEHEAIVMIPQRVLDLSQLDVERFKLGTVITRSELGDVIARLQRIETELA